MINPYESPRAGIDTRSKSQFGQVDQRTLLWLWLCLFVLFNTLCVCSSEEELINVWSLSAIVVLAFETLVLWLMKFSIRFKVMLTLLMLVLHWLTLVIIGLIGFLFGLGWGGR